MEFCANCQENFSSSLLKLGVYSPSDTVKLDLVEKLNARIIELEFELHLQKTAAEKDQKQLKVTWGDNFHDDSLF